MIRKHLFLFLLLVFSLSACQRSAGPGGAATIKGKIYVDEYVGTTYQGSYYGPDIDVYIIYGEESNMYDDRIRTSFDGSYEFRNLQKGMYRVFAYSKDITGASLSGITTEMITVEITGKKDVVTLEDIKIRN